MAPARFTNLAAARAQFGDRVDRLAPFLERTDVLADDVVETIASLDASRGDHAGSALFDRALSTGIDRVPDAPSSFRALFHQLDEVPPWLDWKLLDEGGSLLLRAGPIGGLVLGTKSLIHGYASPGGNKPLMLSGRLSAKFAARRLNETSRFVQAVSQPGGMRRFGDGFAITVKVRLMHAQVRRMILASGRWNADAWGAPINQHDTSATTLLFSLSVIEGVRTLGLAVSREEADAYMQLWRWTGLVIGGDPALVPTSELDARRLADLIAATQGTPDDDARVLTRALLNVEREGLTDPRQIAIARRRGAFGRAIARTLLGPALADQLAIRPSRLDSAIPIFRATVRASEAVRLRVPGLHAQAIAKGTRYWQRVVEVGLAGATAEFGLPDRLHGLGTSPLHAAG